MMQADRLYRNLTSRFLIIL